MDGDTTDAKYRAPALEKGLDILELLAREKRPLMISQMAILLNRSVSEIFRMALILQSRGYLETSEGSDALVLSNKLFLLGMSQGPSQNLVARAIPLMQALSKKAQEACHLVITAEDKIVVIARVEAPGDLGYSVRVGHMRPITASTSGVILYAFQTPNTRLEWRERLMSTMSAEEWQGFEAHADRARELGHIVRPSAFVKAVTDISFPVFSDLGVTAALTMPYLETSLSADIETCIGYLKSTSEALSRELGA